MKPVWAREEIFTTQCPKSLITAQSLNFLHEYNLWKQFRWRDTSEISAKTADAIALLEEAWEKEKHRGETEE